MQKITTKTKTELQEPTEGVHAGIHITKGRSVGKHNQTRPLYGELAPYLSTGGGGGIEGGGEPVICPRPAESGESTEDTHIQTLTKTKNKSRCGAGTSIISTLVVILRAKLYTAL